MATEPKRVLVTVSAELAEQLDDIKRRAFYADTWSEMYRKLLEEGAKAYAPAPEHSTA